MRRLLADNLRLRQLGIDAEADTMDHPARPRAKTEPDAPKPLTHGKLAEFERLALEFHDALARRIAQTARRRTRAARLTPCA